MPVCWPRQSLPQWWFSPKFKHLHSISESNFTHTVFPNKSLELIQILLQKSISAPVSLRYDTFSSINHRFLKIWFKTFPKLSVFKLLTRFAFIFLNDGQLGWIFLSFLAFNFPEFLKIYFLGILFSFDSLTLFMLLWFTLWGPLLLLDLTYFSLVLLKGILIPIFCCNLLHSLLKVSYLSHFSAKMEIILKSSLLCFFISTGIRLFNLFLEHEFFKAIKILNFHWF